jgi:uncharacterized OB-fold protein
MKCSNCGKENSSKSRYCINCGKSLNAKIICTNCGKALEPDSNFCDICGTKVKISMRIAEKAALTAYKSKKAAAGKKSSKKSGKKSGFNNAAAYAILAVFIIGVTWLVFWTLSSPSGFRKDNIVSESVTLNPPGPGPNTVWSSEVQAIAANFNCPCGSCGITRLDVCTCDTERGAQTVKAYIQSLLDQGLTKYDVVDKVEEIYGNRI